MPVAGWDRMGKGHIEHRWQPPVTASTYFVQGAVLVLTDLEHLLADRQANNNVIPIVHNTPPPQ